MTIINMTPHPISILGEDLQEIKTFESAGQVRLAVEVEKQDYLDGIPTSKTVFGKPEGLPEYEKDTYYIVSQLIKSSLPERDDLLVPAEVVRGEKGIILGCKSLGR